MDLKISKGNSKLGDIPSVSLPAGITCREDCECGTKCYAAKLERLRPNVKAAYRHNLEVLEKDPETYWREVEAAIMMARFFRFHVSGDIPNAEYFEKMVEVAKRNRHCEILCFTKKYDIVNNFIYNGWAHRHTMPLIPKNLHIIYSAWRNLLMKNPYGLPEAHVRYRDGSTTASEKAKECGGNCTDCAVTNEGCWTLGVGEQVVFNEH